MYEWINDPSTIDPTFALLPTDEQRAIRALLSQAAKDASTTPRPTPLGFTPARATLESKAEQFANVKRLPKKTLAEKVADEIAECDGCTGTCHKTHDRWRVPYVGVDEYNGEEIARYPLCRFGRQRELELDFRSAKIPPRYLKKTFDDYRVDTGNRDAVTFAKNIEQFKCGAYLYGECGTGKTFLAALIAQEFLKRGKSVLFVKVPRLLDDIRATFDGNRDERDLLDKIAATTLVVLDDFGMEKPTQWAGTTLCKILDMRYDEVDTVTILTSNLSIDELAAQLNNASDGANLNGSRIADRLREMSKPILLRGTTRRN